MKTVFLDRDGTLIVDPPDLRVEKIEELELFPDTIDALRYLAEHDFNVVIITNQAGIAEGLLTEAEFWVIQNKFVEMLAPSGVHILKTYMSPHGSNEVNDWRKPGPGMLIQAAKDFDLDLSQIFIVGDRHSDVLAGINAGTKTVLVKTANQNEEAPEADYTAPNLMEAVKYIVSCSSNP